MSSITSSTPLTAAPAVEAPHSNESDVVLVPSQLLGSIPVPSQELFRLDGLFGFESCTSFALVPAGRDGLWWLQSVDRAELVFLLADPFTFFPGHIVDVPPTELAQLDATDETPLTALVIVTLPARDGDAPTANLRAPIILDAARRVARQIVLGDDSLSLTAPVSL